ncbi:hypothetical protein NM208_g5733 [Fusarium decemcellulare]|uniref:Uncharacterized protein n=1 Tax=Fusarium decemcellulare TaxID=57161 RepID=A0ACC1SFS4_9HYPO|nr:hypothetical protein NM208_g5733 [Fusarium decemcellulare]
MDIRQFDVAPLVGINNEHEYSYYRVVAYGDWSDLNSDHPNLDARLDYEGYRDWTIPANSIDYHIGVFARAQSQPRNGTVPRYECGLTWVDLRNLANLCYYAIPIGISHCNARAEFLNKHPFAYLTLAKRQNHEGHLVFAQQQLAD